MLLLIEQSNKNHDGVTRSDIQHGQHLLEYNTPEEDEEPDGDDVTAGKAVETKASCAQVSITTVIN